MCMLLTEVAGHTRLGWTRRSSANRLKEFDCVRPDNLAWPGRQQAVAPEIGDAPSRECADTPSRN